MRVGPILREPLAIQRIGSKREQQGKIDAMLDEVGLPRVAVERYPHEFSGGQRQRLGLARALILNPKLLVADEPVSALDVSIQSQILNLMQDLQRDLGLTYLFISHDLSVVRYMSETIGVMYLGKLVEVGSGQRRLLPAAHPYTKGLIDTIPVADPRATRAKQQGVAGELPSADRPAVRLPVPDPLPVCPGAVRRGGATATALHGQRALGRLPLPAVGAGGGDDVGRRRMRSALAA